MFNRAPEGQGLNYWYYQALENGWDMSQLANAMLDGAKSYVQSDPTAAEIYPQYANLDTTNPDSVKAVIDTVYKILFNKDSSTDPEGVQHWVDDVVNNGVSLGETIANIVKAAEDYLNSDDPAAKAAAEAFENKAQVALYVAEKFPKFDGDFTKFQKFVKIVTDDPSTIKAAEDLADAYAPQSFTLTTKADMITGGFGDDSFFGLIDTSNSANTTLNSYDQLDGNEGNDTLFARINLANGGTANTAAIQASIQNIENFNITVFKVDNANHEVDVDNDYFPELKNIIISNDNSIRAGNVLYNISNFVDDGVVTVDGGNKGADITVAYKDTTADDDNKTVKLTNDAVVNTLTMNGIETITIDSIKGDNSIASINANNAKTIVVTGAGNTELKNVANNSIETLDASNATGDVVFGSTANTIDDDTTTVKGGSGDDTFFFTNSQIAADDVIDGGEGTDTVVLQGGTSANDSVIKNVEVLGIDNSNGNTWDLSVFTNTSIQKVAIQKGGALTGDATISNITDQTIEINDTSTSNTITLSTKDETYDTVNVKVSVGKNTKNGADINDINVNSNVKTLNLTVTDPENNLADGQTTDINGLDTETVTLNATSNTSLTFAGNTTKTIDASASTADVTVNATNAYADATTNEGVSVTTGSGDDTVTGTAKNDTINTGDGDDVVKNSDGNDTINTGAGDDTVYFSYLL
jgi:hypothetical protein